MQLGICKVGLDNENCIELFHKWRCLPSHEKQNSLVPLFLSCLYPFWQCNLNSIRSPIIYTKYIRNIYENNSTFYFALRQLPKQKVYSKKRVWVCVKQKISSKSSFPSTPSSSSICRQMLLFLRPNLSPLSTAPPQNQELSQPLDFSASGLHFFFFHLHCSLLTLSPFPWNFFHVCFSISVFLYLSPWFYLTKVSKH